MSTFSRRMIKAAKLDPSLYEEVEKDTRALGQALLVVVLSSLAAGLAYLGTRGFGFVLTGIATSLVGWFVWAYMTYIIGTKILPQTQTVSTVGELLRTLGFSSSPGILRILGIIPGLLALANTVAFLWMLVAMIVAVRQALDYTSTGRAVLVAVIGWLVYIIIFFLVYRVAGV